MVVNVLQGLKHSIQHISTTASITWCNTSLGTQDHPWQSFRGKSLCKQRSHLQAIHMHAARPMPHGGRGNSALHWQLYSSAGVITPRHWWCQCWDRVLGSGRLR